MEKYALVIDVAKCEDCNNCFLACKDEHVGNDWSGYTASQPIHGHRWMNIFRKERGQFPLIDVAYLPVPCMHCDNAPCIKAAKNGCIFKRDDGIVIIDPSKAVGQKELIKSCPYDAIWWNEEKNVPQKCTLCAHLMDDGWKEPRCVQACPTGALKAHRVDEHAVNRFKETESLDILKPELNTQPRVYYKNLFRYTTCFVGGSIAFNNGDVVDCADGAEVVLLKDGETMATMKTDNFGDFKFDNLEENSGGYRLEIKFRDYEKKTMEIDVQTSLNVGTIIF
jgi:Fe-S-cluster-containing dehydrogenase component